MIIGLVGASGNWGKNYLRTLTEKFPQIKIKLGSRENWKNLNNEVDGVIISTPASTHLKLASYFNPNIPLLIEKPLALSNQIIKEYLDINRKNILVNHNHLFSSAYQDLKNKSLGKIRFVNSVGVGNGPYRTDCSVLYDYGPHQISILLDLLNLTKIPTKPKNWFEHIGFVEKYPGMNSTGTIYKIQGSLWKHDNFNQHYAIWFGNGAYDKYRKLTIETTDGNLLSYNQDETFFNGKENITYSSLPLENCLHEFIKIMGGASQNSNLLQAIQVNESLEIINKLTN